MYQTTLQIARGIKRAREKAGLSKAELARLAGVSRSVITETEKPTRHDTTLFTAVKLARALGKKVYVEIK